MDVHYLDTLLGIKNPLPRSGGRWSLGFNCVIIDGESQEPAGMCSAEAKSDTSQTLSDFLYNSIVGGDT
jgi:hypothetical protein